MKKKRANNRPFPTVAVVGLCFGLLAFAATLSIAHNLSFVPAFTGFVLSLGATVLFGGVVAEWIFS